MPLEYNLQQNVENLGDTAPLIAFLTEPNGEVIPASGIASVQYTIQAPAGQKTSYQGEIQEDGGAKLNFSETNEPGHYIVVATFTLKDGIVKSTTTNFQVQNPYQEPEPIPQTELEAVTQAVWTRMGDCFVAGTQVLMADGITKSIENIDIDDNVIDAYGSIQKVTKIICRPEEEHIYKIRHYGHTHTPLEATGNHPILVIDQKYSNKELETLSRAEIYDLAHWRNVSELKPGDWVVEVIPSYRQEITSINPNDFDRVKIDDNLILCRTFDITKEKFQGNVYCLEVTNSHTFVANGIGVHNCFDSADGGPWLREMTLRVFNPNRISEFVNEGVFEYNATVPPTEYVLQDFVASENLVAKPNPLFPVIVQATFLAIIRHLMRSYAEQPLPQGGEINYEDRRDYIARWQGIYDIEMKIFERWVALSKRHLYGLGTSKSLVYSKSRGAYFPGAPWRGRGLMPFP